MGEPNGKTNEIVEKINNAVEDGSGCTEAWEALSEFRAQSQSSMPIHRRSILKGIGAGAGAVSTTAALSGQAFGAPSEDKPVSKTRLKGKEAHNLVKRAHKDKETKEILKQVRSSGFAAPIGHAIAERLEIGDSSENGVAIPLKNPPEKNDLWSNVSTSDQIETTIGYATWRSGNESARAVILGTTLTEVDPEELLAEDAENILNFGTDNNVVAVKIITPESSYTDEVRDAEPATHVESGPTTQKTVTTQAETVPSCVGDNLGLIEVGDDILSCGTCLFPGDGLGIGDIFECAWCLYELGVNGCVIGYCQQEYGGSVGDTFCVVAGTVASTPLWLLPIGNSGVHFAAITASYGCGSDEATDCTSPIIP